MKTKHISQTGRAEAPSVSFQSAGDGPSVSAASAAALAAAGFTDHQTAALARALARLNAAKGCRYLTDAEFLAPFEK